jgi:hypothetical protein
VQASEGFGEIHERAPRATLHRALTITDAGLALGRGTVLARMSPDA